MMLEKKFMGKTLVLDLKYPVGEVHMHPQTLYEITGCLPDGIRTHDIILIPKEKIAVEEA